MADPLPNRTEPLPDERIYNPSQDDSWAPILRAVLEELSINSIVSGPDRTAFDPIEGQLFVPTTQGEQLARGNGTAWVDIGQLVDPQTITDLQTNKADKTELTSHASATGDVHGIAATDTVAGESDITAHASAASDVHGIAATDSVAGVSDVTAHSNSTGGVHGIAATDSVAAQSAVDGKADSPHDNMAHSTNYSAEGHTHTGETILPEMVHYQARATNPAAPASGAITYMFDDGVTKELRAINSAGTVVTLATF